MISLSPKTINSADRDIPVHSELSRNINGEWKMERTSGPEGPFEVFLASYRDIAKLLFGSLPNHVLYPFSCCSTWIHRFVWRNCVTAFCFPFTTESGIIPQLLAKKPALLSLELFARTSYAEIFNDLFKLTTLTMLHLNCMVKTDPKIPFRKFSKLQRLVSLELNDANGIKGREIAALANLTNLKILEISACVDDSYTGLSTSSVQ